MATSAKKNPAQKAREGIWIFLIFFGMKIIVPFFVTGLGASAFLSMLIYIVPAVLLLACGILFEKSPLALLGVAIVIGILECLDYGYGIILALSQIESTRISFVAWAMLRGFALYTMIKGFLWLRNGSPQEAVTVVPPNSPQ